MHRNWQNWIISPWIFKSLFHQAVRLCAIEGLCPEVICWRSRVCMLVEWFIVMYSYEITHEKLSWEGHFFSITWTWPMCVAISGWRSYYKAVVDLSICKAPGFDVFCVYFREDSSIPCSCIVRKNFCVIYRKLMSHSFRWTLPPTVSMYHNIFMKGKCL